MIFRLESPLGISPTRLQGRYPAGCRLSPPDRAGQRRTGPLLSRCTKWVLHRLTVRCGKLTICRLFTWGNYRSSTSMLAYNRYHLHTFTVTKQSMVIFSSTHEDVTSHFFSWWPPLNRRNGTTVGRLLCDIYDLQGGEIHSDHLGKFPRNHPMGTCGWWFCSLWMDKSSCTSWKKW